MKKIGVAAVVTVYAMGDMIVFNRRKKREFHIEQKQIHLAQLAAAREAIALNTATPEQIEFIEMEEKLDRYEEGLKNKPGMLKRTTEWLTSGLSKEDAAAAAKEEESGIMKAVQDRREEIKDGVEKKKEDFTETARAAWDREKKLQEQGGMLDRVGLDEKPKTGGWTSWMSR